MLEILCPVQDLIKYIQDNKIIFAVHINPENIGLCFFFSLYSYQHFGSQVLSTLFQVTSISHISCGYSLLESPI